MIGLGIKGYLRNKWFNFFTILIISFMMVSAVILITTMEKRTRLYRMTEPYMGEKGMCVNMISSECINKLKKVDKCLVGKSFYVDSEFGGMNLLIYCERVEKYLKPDIEKGVWVSEAKKSDDMISAVVSNNYAGIKVGDEINFEVTDDEGKPISRKISICGMFSDGQKVYENTDFFIDENFDITDMFTTFSFEQMENVTLITNEDEFFKFDKNIDTNFYKAIIKFEDDISEEDYQYNIKVLDDYQAEFSGLSGTIDDINKLDGISKRSKKAEMNLYAKYIPLIIAAFVLVCIGIIGITAVKTSLNSKYFGKLFICGMNWNGIIFFVIYEMIINLVLAFSICKIIIWILNLYPRYGKIYAEFSGSVNTCIGLMSLGVLLISALMTFISMRENQPVAILRGN